MSTLDLAEAIRRKAEEAASSIETLTDSGNASRLIRLHGSRLRYVPTWGKWIVCGTDHGFWDIDYGDVGIRELAKNVGLNLKVEAGRMSGSEDAKKLFSFAFKSLEAYRISAMVNLARGIHGVPLHHERLDRDAWLLGVANGVIDLRIGQFRPADPSDLMTLRCPTQWDEDAGAPRFEQAMVEWFPDPEARAYVKRVAGSTLVGAQRDHVFIVHYGLGGNGKGTFTRALQRVLGPYAVEVHRSLLVNTRFKEHDTVRADLFRTRLAIAVETERRVQLAEASVKNLTGGDRIRARRMREDPWSFDPTHSLWLQTNHLPRIDGRDAGIWRRIRVVRWVSAFEGRAVDFTLDDSLADETSGILRWLVEGCLEWQEHGLAEPEAVIRETLNYRSAEDSLSRFQTDIGLVFRPGLEVQAMELRDVLTKWAEEEGIDPPTQQVGEWLRDKGAAKKQRRDGDGKRRRYWIGVGIEGAGNEGEQTVAL